VSPPYICEVQQKYRFWSCTTTKDFLTMPRGRINCSWK